MSYVPKLKKKIDPQQWRKNNDVDPTENNFAYKSQFYYSLSNYNFQDGLIII